ncbi:MAG TPA: SulP family inorganic anion transporter [Jatrophihabitans sp.]|nr:SulP family inorganic anion transporter [Jatrophihabitans sp.]
MLAALVVGIALIPEAISFSVIAHVDPRVGLFASFTMAVAISIVGGRPAMISAATGSVALVVATLSIKYGLNYLVAAVLLAGVIQVVLGLVGVANLMRFVPRSVMTGFVNALGILLFLAQLPNLHHVPWAVYPLVGVGLVIMVFFPKLTAAVPAPLVAIVVLTAFTIAARVAVPTVGDKGKLPNSLPHVGFPNVPLTAHTLSIIALPAVTMALVGLLESLLTARLVDDLTDTGSNKNRESCGQGVANIVTGFFGGMGGCAMIGQTMINIKAGARTRVSTFLAGVFLLILVVVCGPVASRIPMAALVAVMVLVSVSTFDWSSVTPTRLKRMPKSETAVMALTVVVTVSTGNLAYGVLAGVVLACLLFARRVAHLSQVTAVTDPDTQTVVYRVAGELFFASSSLLADHFDFAGDPDRVVIDLSDSHVWDASTVAALDQVVAKYAHRGKAVEIIGLNQPSEHMHGRLSGHLSSSH